MTSSDLERFPSSGIASGLTPVEAQLVLAAINTVIQIADTVGAVATILAETRRFTAEVDALERLVLTDAREVWNIVQPLVQALLSQTLPSTERLRIIEAVERITAPSLKARAAAIEAVASKVR